MFMMVCSRGPNRRAVLVIVFWLIRSSRSNLQYVRRLEYHGIILTQQENKVQQQLEMLHVGCCTINPIGMSSPTPFHLNMSTFFPDLVGTFQLFCESCLPTEKLTFEEYQKLCIIEFNVFLLTEFPRLIRKHIVSSGCTNPP